MAATRAQINKLPKSAFAYPATRSYPVPTRTQAKAAGISEANRVKMHRAALSYSARKSTSGSYAVVSSRLPRDSPVKPTRSTRARRR
jgi:hypothetical protein